MQEVCYCGRTGEVEDREPVIDGEGGALRCPNDECGHIDRLLWLSPENRRLVMEEAERRSALRRSPAAA
jgi:hypothetical protein